MEHIATHTHLIIINFKFKPTNTGSQSSFKRFATRTEVLSFNLVVMYNC